MRVRRGWRQSGETQSCLALGLKTGYKGQGEYQEAPFLVFCRSLAGVGPFSRFGHGRGRRETKMGAPGLGIQGHFQLHSKLNKRKHL